MIGLKPLISSKDFIDVVNAIAAAESVNELADSVRRLATFDSGSYHHIPSIGSYDYNHKGSNWSFNLDDAVLNYLAHLKDVDIFSSNPSNLVNFTMQVSFGRCKPWRKQLTFAIAP